jgi:hypothetical protein
MKIILAGMILGMLLVFSNIHVSDSYLQYNLLVTVKPEKIMINPNDFPVIWEKLQMKHNSEYRLFPVSGYYNTLKLNNTEKSNYIISTWNNYSVPN